MFSAWDTFSWWCLFWNGGLANNYQQGCDRALRRTNLQPCELRIQTPLKPAVLHPRVTHAVPPRLCLCVWCCHCGQVQTVRYVWDWIWIILCFKTGADSYGAVALGDMWKRTWGFLGEFNWIEACCNFHRLANSRFPSCSSFRTIFSDQQWRWFGLSPSPRL